MATYNGERFVAEQIDSLLNQTVQDFTLFIRDDCSTDGTFDIISEYAAKHPNRILVSRNEKNSGSPKYNFIRMMIEYKDDYLMLCDQDDVWLPDKIEKSLNKIRLMESEYGTGIPIVVHSDLQVVDESLNVISYSFMRDMVANYSKTALNNLVVQNTLTGCAAIYNRALADMITFEPDYMIMHDWWLILAACAFGKVGTIYEPTILYRQHGSNDIGARKIRSFGHIFHKLTHIHEMTDALDKTYKQAGSFSRTFDDRFSPEQKLLLEAYSSMPKMSGLKKLKTLNKYKTFKHGFARKTAQIIIALTERRVIK
jgi:glycosyltransferase involved in cell wall biosynthesis